MADKARRLASALRKAKAAAEGAEGGGGGGGGAASSGAKGLLGLGLLGYGAYSSMYNVASGQRAVMFSRLDGVSDEVIGEGTHFRVPWLHLPQIFDVRARRKAVETKSGTRDLQMVSVKLSVLSKPDVSELPGIYQRLGQNWDDRVLPSIINETLKQVIAQFNAAEIVTKRELVSKQINMLIQERGKEFNIIFDDVNLVDVEFSTAFQTAVESKQIAEQEAERAAFIVDRAKQEARSVEIKAQGEAESASLISAAIKGNPGFVELRRIDRARDIAVATARGNNRVFLQSDGLMLNLLDDFKLKDRVNARS